MTYFRSLRTFAFFFLFSKYVNNQHVVSRFLQTDRKFLQNAAYERFQSTEHVSSGTFYLNFKIEKLPESAVVIY